MSQGGQTNERKNGRTDKQTNESPPVFYRTSSPLGPLPKKIFIPPYLNQGKSQLQGSNSNLEAQIPASMLKFQPPRSNPVLRALIPASRLKSLPQGSNLSLKAQIPASRLKSQPPGSNPSLEAQIPSLRLKSHPRGSNPSL